MNDLTRLRAALDEVELGDGGRIDGWTGTRRRTFLIAITEGRTVENACGLVGLSVASAYALRRRAGGEAFALGWRAAGLLGRERLADIFTTRAIDGQVDTYTRADGQEVTRHRYDNRLGLAMLARLDRYADAPPPLPARRAEARPSAEDPGEAARTIAADFPAFLALIETAGDAVDWRAFVEAAIAARKPQLPQLRGGANSPFWWDGDGWCTALPPPLDFRGDEYGEPGDPEYHRTLTEDETDIAEALAGADLDDDDEDDGEYDDEDDGATEDGDPARADLDEAEEEEDDYY